MHATRDGTGEEMMRAGGGGHATYNQLRQQKQTTAVIAVAKPVLSAAAIVAAAAATTTTSPRYPRGHEYFIRWRLLLLLSVCISRYTHTCAVSAGGLIYLPLARLDRERECDGSGIGARTYTRTITTRYTFEDKTFVYN